MDFIKDTMVYCSDDPNGKVVLEHESDTSAYLSILGGDEVTSEAHVILDKDRLGELAVAIKDAISVIEANERAKAFLCVDEHGKYPALSCDTETSDSIQVEKSWNQVWVRIVEGKRESMVMLEKTTARKLIKQLQAAVGDVA